MTYINRITQRIEWYVARPDISDEDKLVGLETLKDVIADVTAKMMSGKVTGVFTNCTLETAPFKPWSTLSSSPDYLSIRFAAGNGFVTDQSTDEMQIHAKDDGAIVGVVIKGINKMVLDTQAKMAKLQAAYDPPMQPPTQLPTLPGFIFRDKPTEEVVGPGKWMPILTRNDDAIGLVIPDVGIVATVMPNGRYSIGPNGQGSRATAQKAKDAVELSLVKCGNKYGYTKKTKHHITAEVVDDVEFDEYLVLSTLPPGKNGYIWYSNTYTTCDLAVSQYAGHISDGRPVSLCGILPGGVPVLLKSYDPEKEKTKP